MMGRSPPHLLGALAALFLLVGVTSAQEQSYVGVHDQRCQDFVAGRHLDLSWTHEDCIGVWTDMAASIEEKYHDDQIVLPDVNDWRGVADEMRRVGSPCLVRREPTFDGVGSTSIRIFASMLFAEQVGCDMIMPVWGNGGNGTEYCHSLYKKHEKVHTKRGMRPVDVCSKVDWFSYFQFGVTSVPLPRSGKIKIVRTVRFLEGQKI